MHARPQFKVWYISNDASLWQKCKSQHRLRRTTLLWSVSSGRLLIQGTKSSSRPQETPWSPYNNNLFIFNKYYIKHPGNNQTLSCVSWPHLSGVEFVLIRSSRASIVWRQVSRTLVVKTLVSTKHLNTSYRRSCLNMSCYKVIKDPSNSLLIYHFRGFIYSVLYFTYHWMYGEFHLNEVPLSDWIRYICTSNNHLKSHTWLHILICNFR